MEKEENADGFFVLEVIENENDYHIVKNKS